MKKAKRKRQKDKKTTENYHMKKTGRQKGTTFSDWPHFSTYDNTKLPHEKRQKDKNELFTLIGYICQHTTTKTTFTPKKTKRKNTKF